jgi:predicted GNAT family acetyltransferase
MSMSAFRDNAGAHRYEFDAPEGLSLAEYRDVGAVRAITHVETPAEARGRGYASRLMHAVVEDAKARGLKLRASCAFAVAYFKRHPAEVESIQA